jgi:hypothetical protein
MPMTFRRLFRYGMLTSALALAACQGPMYSRPLSFGILPIETAWTAGFAGGTGYVELHNLPATADVNDFLADIPSPAGAAPAIGFTANPEQATDRRYRVVMIFNAPLGTDGAKACTMGAESPQTVSSAAVGEVQAALCADQERVSEIRFTPGPETVLGDGNRKTDHEVLAHIMRHLYRPMTEPDSDSGCTVNTVC